MQFEKMGEKEKVEYVQINSFQNFRLSVICVHRTMQFMTGFLVSVCVCMCADDGNALESSLKATKVENHTQLDWNTSQRMLSTSNTSSTIERRKIRA